MPVESAQSGQGGCFALVRAGHRAVVINDLPASSTTDAGAATVEGADAAEQMAAATEALRAKLPLLQGDGPLDPYPV